MTPEEHDDDAAALAARGAPADVVARLVASGIPGLAVVRSIGTMNLTSSLRHLFRPRSALNRAELERLTALAALADAVLEMERGADGAWRFWTAKMPWLGGKTPAETLAGPRGPGIVEDLVNRIRYGIPP